MVSNFLPVVDKFDPMVKDFVLVTNDFILVVNHLFVMGNDFFCLRSLWNVEIKQIFCIYTVLSLVSFLIMWQNCFDTHVPILS